MGEVLAMQNNGGDVRRGVTYYHVPPADVGFRFNVDTKVFNEAMKSVMNVVMNGVVAIRERQIHLRLNRQGLSTGFAPKLGKAIDI